MRISKALSPAGGQTSIPPPKSPSRTFRQSSVFATLPCHKLAVLRCHLPPCMTMDWFETSEFKDVSIPTKMLFMVVVFFSILYSCNIWVFRRLGVPLGQTSIPLFLKLVVSIILQRGSTFFKTYVIRFLNIYTTLLHTLNGIKVCSILHFTCTSWGYIGFHWL